MQQDIIHALSGIWQIIALVIALMVAAVTAIVYWHEVKYWHMEMRLRLPWIGRIAAWRRQPGVSEKPSPENPNPVGFNTGESELCGTYETYYREHHPSEENFRRNQDYLGTIGEADRSEKGIGLWLLIIVLMLIEASAFGFALAPFALTLATPNTAIVGAFFIGLVISIIGLFLSEFSGRQLYRNGVVNKLLSFESIRDGGDMTKTHNITLDTNYDDKDAKEFQRMLNRFTPTTDKHGQPVKRYWVVSGYMVFIVGLAIAAFWVRTETLNQQEAMLVDNPTTISQSADDFPVASGDDEIPLPTDMAELSADTTQKSAQDQIDAIHRASLVTFAVLSGLFVFIQFTSTFLAFKHGFVGIYSRRAWELTHKFSSATEYVNHHKRIARSIAQDAQSSLAKLQALQGNVFRISGKTKQELNEGKENRTFKRYIEEVNAKEINLAHIAKNQEIGKQSTNLIRSYVKKTIDDLDAATQAGDNQRIEEIIAIAGPRFEAINDPDLNSEKERFYAVVQFFGAKAQVAPAPRPVQAAPLSAPEPVAQVAPAPQPVMPVEVAPDVSEGQQAVVPVTLAGTSKGAGFDPHAWGDLTVFEAEDMEYVANKKGAAVEDLKRARRLQLLDKVEA